MSFIDSLKSNLTRAAEFTAQKTNELSETAKLKLKESKLTGEINDVYAEIGKLIYKQYKEQSDETQEIAAKCLDIDGKNAELSEIAKKLAEIKEIAEEQKAQRKAAAEAARSADAAPAEKEMPAEEAPAEEAAEEAPAAEEEVKNTKICPACGKEISNDAAFCPICGQKQEG